MSGLDHGAAPDHHGLNDAATDTVDKGHTDLPVPQGEPADDNTTLPRSTRRSQLTAALRTIAASNQSADPIRYRRRWLEDLETRADTAEQHARSEQRSLQAAIEAMQRRDTAEREARKNQQAKRRICAAEDAEQQRLRRNAKQRAAYARQRAKGRARTDGRTGLHAIAIVVDPAAYVAVKAEAYQRRISIPVLLGEILSPTPPTNAAPAAQGPRWRRTGRGRRANQHTRIHIDDTAWRQLHLDAITAGHTTGRWIGIRVEAWVAGRNPASAERAGDDLADESRERSVRRGDGHGHRANGLQTHEANGTVRSGTSRAPNRAPKGA
ncbi:MAG: hypothetical protein AB7U23_16610 [Dehalococcoidia bacterium]